VEHSRKVSPLGNLKMSMSYDRKKLSLQQYIKQRKTYTNGFHRKGTSLSMQRP
jgi:hypothetical protein